jgi:lipopolysaccharide exporter
MKREIATGAAWMILMRLCDRLLGLASTLVLARLLVPADFGLVAMAMSFITLIELAGAFSFEVALIQRSDPTRAHYDTAWTLNLGFALLCAGMTAVLAPLAARFYAEPRLTLLMCVLAIGWAIQGFENIGIVNFRRRMDFASEFRFMFSKRLVGFVVTLTLAYAWRSYWALVAGQTAIRFAGVILSYAMESYRPRLSLAARRDLFSFSGWMLVTNVLGFGLARLPHFLIGRVAGPAALGMYTISSEFARLPSTELAAPINRAVLPGLARIKDDRAELQRIFSDVMGMTFALTLPASLGLAMVATPLVQVVLGTQWLEAAPLLAVLATAGAIEVIAANNGTAYLVIGHTRLAAAMSAIKLVILVGGAALLVPGQGVFGMALAELVASGCIAVISTVVLLRVLAMPARVLVSALWRTVAASLAMAATMYAYLGSPLAPPVEHSPWVLGAAIGMGAASYLTYLFGLWWLSGRPPGAERVVLNRAAELLKSFAPVRSSGS